jgi:hypothetical protein
MRDGTVVLGPLGLVPDFSVSSDIVAKLRDIEAFDMVRQKRALAEKKWNANYLDLMERELKRFLSLRLLFPAPKHPFAPSRAVDAAWHVFILDTRRYTSFCQGIFGTYVHHEPEDTSSATLARNAGLIFGFTKDCLRQAYGGLSTWAWGGAAACDHPACVVGCFDPELSTGETSV